MLAHNLARRRAGLTAASRWCPRSWAVSGLTPAPCARPCESSVHFTSVRSRCARGVCVYVCVCVCVCACYLRVAFAAVCGP